MRSAIRRLRMSVFLSLLSWRNDVFFFFSFLIETEGKVLCYSPSRDIVYQTIAVHLLLAHSSTCMSMFEGYLVVEIGGLGWLGGLER